MKAVRVATRPCPSSNTIVIQDAAASQGPATQTTVACYKGLHALGGPLALVLARGTKKIPQCVRGTAGCSALGVAAHAPAQIAPPLMSCYG
jgi:hypothetical protein